MKQIPLSYYQWAIDSYEEPATIDTNELLELNPDRVKKGGETGTITVYL